MRKKLSKNKIRILANLCRANRPLSVKRIAERNKIAWKTANENIKDLEKRKLIKCVRTKRRTYCRVSKDITSICNKNRKY